jgi:hypothetical protein
MTSLAWRQARKPQASGPQLSISFDSMLSPTYDADAAERFFRKVLQASHVLTPRVITVDKNVAYPPAFEALQQEGMLPKTYLIRPCKYLNNVIEQDHRCVKRRVNPGLGVCGVCHGAATIQGYKAIHMLRKGQIDGIAKRELASLSLSSNQSLQHNPRSFRMCSLPTFTPCIFFPAAMSKISESCH